jgi:hypothetical protein
MEPGARTAVLVSLLLAVSGASLGVVLLGPALQKPSQAPWPYQVQTVAFPIHYNGTALIPNGTVTPGIVHTTNVWSFNMVITGSLTGHVALNRAAPGWTNTSEFLLMNDSDYAGFLTQGSNWSGPTYAVSAPISPWSIVPQVFNFSFWLTGGNWHLIFLVPGVSGQGAPPEPVFSLIWTGGLWVHSFVAPQGPTISPPPPFAYT